MPVVSRFRDFSACVKSGLRRSGKESKPVDTLPATRQLNRFEQSRIDKYVRKAFQELPEKLVREMASNPPATQEVADLCGADRKALENDRESAIGMIALHTVMRQVIEARNRYWHRDERERMSNQIDDYAQQAILREIKRLQKSGFGEMKAEASRVANKGVSHYTVGVSEYEAATLFHLSAHVMSACLDSAAAGTANGGTDRWKEPNGERARTLHEEDARKIYLALDPAMVEAFSALFTAYDKKVRKDSLVGVDRAEVERLDAAMRDARKHGSSEDAWLRQQSANIVEAMNKACEKLPAELAGEFRMRYIGQFLQLVDPGGDGLKHYDLDLFAPTAAALWKIRCDRRTQAANAPAVKIAEAETDAWLNKALSGLNSLMEEYDHNSTQKWARSENGPSADSSTNWGSDTLEALDAVFLKRKYESANADDLKWRKLERGTFSDLREAYERNLSGVPWSDTRVQESIHGIAAPAMKKLLPENQAATLDALAAYGKSTTEFLIRRGLLIGSLPKADTVISTQQLEGYYRHQQEVIASRRFLRSERMADTGFAIWESAPSYHAQRVPNTGNFPESYIAASPGGTVRMRAIMQHELGHAVDGTLLQTVGVQRSKPAWLPFPLSLPFAFNRKVQDLSGANLFGQKCTVIQTAHAAAAKNGTGITSYAEADSKEFFAESMTAYTGRSGASYRTNAKLQGYDVFSPENLKAQHPKTYELIDELFRSNMDASNATRSLQGTTPWPYRLVRPLVGAKAGIVAAVTRAEPSEPR